MKTKLKKNIFSAILVMILFLGIRVYGAVVNPITNTLLVSTISSDNVLNRTIANTNTRLIIDSPQLMNAIFTGTSLQVVYKLNGNQHINSNADFIVKFFKSNANGNLLSSIGSQTLSSLTGNFYSVNLTIPLGVILGPGDRLAATVTSLGNHVVPPNPMGTSEASYIIIGGCSSCRIINFTIPSQSCKNKPSVFTNTSDSCFGNPTFLWDFGDGTAVSSTASHTYITSGTYQVKLYITNFWECPQQFVVKKITISDCIQPQPLPCTNCIGSFAPQNGDYILSAWVKEDIITNPNVLTYTKPQIYIDFPTTNNPSGSTSSPSLGPFTADGSIIDGWQRIEKEFSILSSATYINLRLQCSSGDCFFDDIRIFPRDGSMKSYVYDPITLRLVAELDERNYATLYEYDEEGKLVRVKKETEKGIMTIKENKNSTKKKP